MNVAGLYSVFDTIITNAQSIAPTRKYWFIRTDGGKYFETFKENGFVAIEDNLITLREIYSLKQKYKENKKIIIEELKKLSKDRYPKDTRTGLIASQIYRFLFEVKKGDIIIIPDVNSSAIAIGEISDSIIPETSNQEIEDTKCNWLKRKKIEWQKFILKNDIDPYLYKMIATHQAISDITHYSDIIERSIQNFFFTEETANLILEVKSKKNINARSLFKLGLTILDYTQDYIDKAGFELDTNDVDVKIALNSPGKIQLSAKSKITLLISALLIIGINGGGLKINICDKFNLDLSTQGAIQNLIDYQNQAHDRTMKDAILNSIDSLKVQTPDDAVKVFQQFSTNKQLAH